MTNTNAERTPSDALTNALAAWQKAFFIRDAEAFAEGFAENIILEASAGREPVEGRDRVRVALWTAAGIYESLVFTDQARNGLRLYVEWRATAFGGQQILGSTILVINQDGKIVHAVIQHRPLDVLLAFAAEMDKRLSSVDAV